MIAITDHSHSLGVVQGMTPEDVLEQGKEIDKIEKELGDKIHILHGAEVEIRSDGSLDYPDTVLEQLDFVLAALHTSLRQPRQKVTERMISAIRNSRVDMIPHPTGRLLPDREGADLDMEAVLAAAKEAGVVMEINAHPARLDLDDVHAKRAIEMGIPLAIDTDAHSESDMDLMHFGVSTARRAWVEAGSVINTWSVTKLKKWLKSRGHKNTVRLTG